MKSIILKCVMALLVMVGATSCSQDLEYTDAKATPVTLFYEPMNGQAVELVNSNSTKLHFEWETSHATSGAMAQYEVAFYKDGGSEVIYKVLADNVGSRPMVSIDHQTLAKVCDAAGIGSGETGKVKWGIIAWASINAAYTPADKLYTLTLTRY